MFYCSLTSISLQKWGALIWFLAITVIVVYFFSLSLVQHLSQSLVANKCRLSLFVLCSTCANASIYVWNFHIACSTAYASVAMLTWQNDVDSIIKLFEAASSNSIIPVLDILQFEATSKIKKKNAVKDESDLMQTGQPCIFARFICISIIYFKIFIFHDCINNNQEKRVSTLNGFNLSVCSALL